VLANTIFIQRAKQMGASSLVYTWCLIVRLTFVDDIIDLALLQHTSVQAAWFASTQAVPGTACGAPPVM
jgi:hypothetical protein